MADKAMTDTEVKALCDLEFNNSSTYTQEIQEERKNALNYYNSDLYGNEEDGFSAFVSSDVRDVIEWMLPQIMDIFIGGDAPVKFRPTDAEDVRQAEIETKYCQHVFENQNKGFLNTYTWFKTALIQKNCVVKTYWDDVVKEENESYENLDYAQYILLSEDENVTIDAITVKSGGEEYTLEEFENYVAENPDIADMLLIEVRADAEVTRKKDVSQIRVEPREPENFFVRRDHNSLDLKDCGYCADRYIMTASDLLDAGYDRDIVDSLPTHNEMEFDEEKVNRFDKEGGHFSNQSSPADDTRREIEIIDHYLYVDADGDGTAELRRIMTAGDHVLENEECDRIPFHAISPYPQPFKFNGRSVADNVEQLQRVTSQLWRSILDNLTYSTIPRKKVKGNVDIDDLLTHVPGGLIRMDANASVENDVIPFVGDAVFPMLQQVENARAERTGFSRETVGLNPAAISNSTNMVGSMILSQSQLLVKMIARIFAETGFKSMMLHIRELMYKHETRENMFEIAGDYVPVNPRTWRKERDTEITVGLGHASKQEEITLIMEILGLQKEIVQQQGGLTGQLVSADNLYNTLSRLSQRIGYKDVGTFFSNPKDYVEPQPQPSQGDIQLQLTERQIELEGMKAEAQNTMKAQELQYDAIESEKDRTLKYTMHKEELDLKEQMHEQELIYKYGELASKKKENQIKELTNGQSQKGTPSA